MRKLIIAIGVCLFQPGSMTAQSQVVVVDSINKTPVPYANVFKAEGGSYRGTTTDESGVATVDFPFKELHIGHVSYNQKILRAIPDTVYLAPKEQVLSEVVVNDKEPQWIRPFFKKFIEKKGNIYRSVTRDFSYSYQTRNASDSTGYWFENSGIIKIPPTQTKELFRIKPEKGYIHFKDTTAGCDFTNMKRMVYNDFIDELDNKFLKQHTFRVNNVYSGNVKDVVQLYFRSLKYGKEDKGYITVDTAKCSILSVARETGMDYNVDHNTNSFTRTTVRTVTGWKYTKWIVKQEVTYSDVDGAYYPSLCRYKAYILAESEKGKYAGKKFDSFESEITFQPVGTQDGSGFFELYEPWYMKIIVSKKERLAEEQLQKISKEHLLY